jgi:hypothetical protein
LQAENLPRTLCTRRLVRLRERLSHTSRNDVNSPLPQFLDFLTHIRLHGDRKLVGEIGDG